MKELIENIERLDLPRKIEKDDIEPRLPEMGGTEIILQRHGKYERSTENSNVGSLTEEGEQEVYEKSKEFFKKLFEETPESERDRTDILVIASDTQYEGGGHRSIETAEEVVKALKEQFVDFGLDQEQLLNKPDDYKNNSDIRPVPRLREPQMFNNSPEFVDFLKEKYDGMGLDFWIAFEEDTEKETREAMGAEGPDDIADRVKFMLNVFARYSRIYHKNHPERRLIIWVATHYDTISPFVKRDVFEVGKEVPLGVDYGAGISIDLDSEAVATTEIAGKEYNIPIKGVN